MPASVGTVVRVNRARGEDLTLHPDARFTLHRMNGMRISQLADRVGVPASTVRYYERVGLIPEPARTDAGYREYDTAAESRLLFITRGKRLGLALDEIRDLMIVWNGTNCSATQVRMAELVAAKRAEIVARIHELEQFVEQLDAVHSDLSANTGPDTCAPDLQCCAPGLPDRPVVLLGVAADHRHTATTKSSAG